MNVCSLKHRAYTQRSGSLSRSCLQKYNLSMSNLFSTLSCLQTGMQFGGEISISSRVSCSANGNTQYSPSSYIGGRHLFLKLALGLTWSKAQHIVSSFLLICSVIYRSFFWTSAGAILKHKWLISHALEMRLQKSRRFCDLCFEDCTIFLCLYAPKIELSELICLGNFHAKLGSLCRLLQLSIA